MKSLYHFSPFQDFRNFWSNEKRPGHISLPYAGMAERILNGGSYKRAPEALTCRGLEILVKLLLPPAPPDPPSPLYHERMDIFYIARC